MDTFAWYLIYTLGLYAVLSIINWRHFNELRKEQPDFWKGEANEPGAFLMRKIGLGKSLIVMFVFLSVFCGAFYFFAPRTDALIYMFGIASGVFLFNAFHDYLVSWDIDKQLKEKRKGAGN